MDIATITAAIGAVTAGIGLIDKIEDQVKSFLTGKPEQSVPQQHRQKIEASGSEIVSKVHGQVDQTITYNDLAKLPPNQLKYISVYEQSMENYFALWAAVYPQRNASADAVTNAKVDQQLKQIVLNMKGDLDSILSFLESCGMRLDDHYMEFRDLVNKVK